MSYSKPNNKKILIPKLSIFALNTEPNFEKLIPFSSLLADGVAITKDYCLVATYEIAGISFECEDDDNLDFRNEALNMMIKSFANEPIAFYFHNCRHTINDKFESNFNNSYLKEIDERYYNAFKEGSLFKNSLFLTIIYNPLGRLEKKTFEKSSLESKRKELTMFLQKFGEYCLQFEAN